jgi:ribosomal protein S18 acetylase RimI-like enzyme
MVPVTEIRRLKASDALDIAALHYTAFEDFFLTSLGKPFLTVFYRSILNNKNGIGVGVFIDSNLVAFAIGTMNNSGFYKALIRNNGFCLALKALPNLITNPGKLRRLKAALLTSGNSTYTDTPSLLSICVSPLLKQAGTGSRLLREFEEMVNVNHGSEIILTTDNLNNFAANQFYKKNNYSCVQSFFQGNREMNLYYKKL